MVKKIDMKALAKLPRHERVRIMTEAMREMNPEEFDKAAAVVARRVRVVFGLTLH